MQGTVIFYNSEKGYGFIKQDDNETDLFFHITECSQIPEANMRVEYAIEHGHRGIKAVNISIIDDTP